MRHADEVNEAQRWLDGTPLDRILFMLADWNEAQIDALKLGYHSAFIRAKQEIEKLKTERTALAGRSFTAQ